MADVSSIECSNGHDAPVGATFCPVCAARVDAVVVVEASPSSWDTGEAVLCTAEQEPEPEPGTEPEPHAAALTSDDISVAELDRLFDLPATEIANISTSQRPRRRKVLAAVAFLVVLAAVAASGVWWFGVRETSEDRYLAALEAGGFTEQYATPDVAIAAGEAFCADLASGKAKEGYDYQKVAVDELCPELRGAVTVVPTPQQQAEELTTTLRDKGLGGLFPSDAAAVAHAESLCRGLDDGAPQQGPEEDAIAVGVYCHEYADGFETLFPIEVKGTFTLFDDDPSYYYSSMGGGDNDCYGDGGYDDIAQGAEVLVKNSAGEVLTTTSLGRGTGVPPYMCEFPIKFSVMDGEEGGYYLEVSHRGQQHYTAAQLKLPDAVSLVLG